MYIKTRIILLLFILPFLGAKAQDDPYKIAQYPFIHYDQNKIFVYDCEDQYIDLFNKFNKLILTGEGNINIIQIGDSHIQSDFLSGRFRQRIQTFFQGGTGGRGFIFPYTMAKTNNPVNYKINYKGNWETCRNIEKDKNCNLGLSGITVSTEDSLTCVSIKLKNKEWPTYDFNKIKVYHALDSFSYKVRLAYPDTLLELNENFEDGITSILLANYTDSIKLEFVKTSPIQNRFELYGFSLETNDPGVIYHAIGVNGADTESYLRCNLFESHLKALHPHLIIVSLGTNDAYPKYFSHIKFEENYDALIQKIKKVYPDIPLLLTVPGDSYRFRKYLNEDLLKVRNIIFDLAIKYHCSVWDFYSVMGGKNSIYLWHKNNLAGKDRLHFTKEGYIIQGDLMFNAFLKKYDEYIDNDKLERTE